MNFCDQKKQYNIITTSGHVVWDDHFQYSESSIVLRRFRVSVAGVFNAEVLFTPLERQAILNLAAHTLQHA